MPEKLSDVRLGGRIMGPRLCPVIYESGETAGVTKAGHRKNLQPVEESP